MPASNFRPLFLACFAVLAGGSLALSACKPRPAQDAPAATSSESQAPSYAAAHVGDYAVVPLKADLARFDENTRRMIAKLVQAAEIMSELTWKQSWDGDRAALLAQAPDEATRQLVDINFGPWDRLNEDTPFIEGIKPRPPGGPFYPVDMTRDEFEAADLPDKKSNYTLLRRDAGGKLFTVPYHVEYKAELERTATLLREAAELSADEAFTDYLRMRADALLSDD